MRALLWTVSLCLLTQLATQPAFALGLQRSIGTVSAAELPKEGRQTITLIKKGGPYPYRKDGAVFGNFEKILPRHERGYYREFTVPTPRARDRGARRIIAGKAGEFYYTDDHYSTFRRVLDP